MNFIYYYRERNFANKSKLNTAKWNHISPLKNSHPINTFRPLNLIGIWLRFIIMFGWIKKVEQTFEKLFFVKKVKAHRKNFFN